MSPSRLAAAAGGALLIALLGSPSIADVISDWSTAVIPPPPELKEVTVDPATTALLLLDIMKANCTARPRCVAAVPNMKRLHDEARAHNMVVWYSLVGSNGKATPDDIMDPGIKPRAGEWYRQSGPDKFFGSTLEPGSGGRHQDRDHLRQLVPGRDRRYRLRTPRSAATRSSFRSTARPARTSITSSTRPFIWPRAARWV